MTDLFDPRPTEYPFPEFTDRHYLVVKKNDGTVFDKDYHYVEKGAGFAFRKRLFDLLLRVVVFPVTRVRLGLRIEGRDILKRYSEELKNGAVCCSNHVHMWDFFCIRRALLPKKPYVLIWAPNIRGEFGRNMRLIGGIPVPDSGVAATQAQLRDIEELLNGGGWLHVYSEGSMWEYYQPIRPFKKGTAHLAAKFDKPLVPMAFSYRRPGWIRRNIFRQTALFTLRIGEPLRADNSLSGHEKIEDLCRRSHRSVCALAGIDPEVNIYPPVFDNTRRVDYY